jgi:hypothetical protein
MRPPFFFGFRDYLARIGSSMAVAVRFHNQNHVFGSDDGSGSPYFERKRGRKGNSPACTLRVGGGMSMRRNYDRATLPAHPGENNTRDAVDIPAVEAYCRWVHGNCVRDQGQTSSSFRNPNAATTKCEGTHEICRPPFGGKTRTKSSSCRDGAKMESSVRCHVGWSHIRGIPTDSLMVRTDAQPSGRDDE